MREKELENGRKVLVHEDEVVYGPYGLTRNLKEELQQLAEDNANASPEERLVFVGMDSPHLKRMCPVCGVQAGELCRSGEEDVPELKNSIHAGRIPPDETDEEIDL